ncbi:MAG: hypothetical protein QOC65_1043 [Sphingomonadales bacterium]|nr:hypothetical protein [Sphingomonadales bacterium]
MEPDGEERLRRRSRQFAASVAVLVVLLAAGMGASMLSAVYGPPRDAPERTILYALYWTPAVLYLWGLAAIAVAFRDVAQGALFVPAVERGLRHLGWSLILGGAANLAVVQLLHGATLPRGFADGRTQIFAGFGFDPAYLVLVLVGASILLVSRLIRIGAEYRERSRLLEAELDEFL